MGRTGRPPITQKQKELIAQKLEPLLKSGLSLNKACSQAGVPRSTVYYLMEKNKDFLDKINLFRQFLSVFFNRAVTQELFRIVKKQNNNEELSKDDLHFLMWFALNSNLTKEEFGRRGNYGISDYDPEVDVQRVARMIDEATKTGVFSE